MVVKIRPEINTRISAVTTNSGSISNLDYNMNTITGSINLAANDSITFNTTVTTYSNVPTALSSIKVYNGASEINNVAITTNPSTVSPNSSYIKICETANNVEVCTIDASKAVAITITNNIGSTISSDNFKVNLTFTPFYTITYNNNVIGEVLQGGTFAYTVDNTITSVTKDSGTGNLDTTSLPSISISNVQSDIVLTGTGGSSGSGTSSDPYINSSQTYDPTNIQEGYTKFDEAPGEPIVTATTTTVNVVEVTKITSFNFTNTGTDGVIFGTNNNSTLDTGVIVFDSSRFSIHIKFKTNVSLTGNKGKFVLAVLEQVTSTTYSGFTINILNSSTPYLQVSGHNNKTYSGTTLNAGQSLKLNSSSDATSNTENTYEITLVYNPNAGQPFTAQCTGTNCYTTSSQTMNKKNIPTTLNNATITIGGNGINNTNDIYSMSVLQLHICKGTFGTNYTCNES